MDKEVLAYFWTKIKSFVIAKVREGATKVKGDNETEYRTGEVNITPENIGAISEIKAESGENIDTVGTPSVDVNTSGSVITLVFNNLKGATGDSGPQGIPGNQGEPGPQGPPGVNATTTEPATATTNGLMSATDKEQHDNMYQLIGTGDIDGGTP